jgi:hypothetical protein
VEINGPGEAAKLGIGMVYKAGDVEDLRKKKQLMNHMVINVLSVVP